MKDTKVLVKNPDVVTRVIEDETILMPIYKSSDEINCIYTLNKQAAFVWDLIDGKSTLAEIKKKILGEFDSPSAEVDKELAGLLKDLTEIKAVK